MSTKGTITLAIKSNSLRRMKRGETRRRGRLTGMTSRPIPSAGIKPIVTLLDWAAVAKPRRRREAIFNIGCIYRRVYVWYEGVECVWMLMPEQRREWVCEWRGMEGCWCGEVEKERKKEGYQTCAIAFLSVSCQAQMIISERKSRLDEWSFHHKIIFITLWAWDWSNYPNQIYTPGNWRLVALFVSLMTVC